MKSLINLEAGIFYAVDNGHVLTFDPLPAGTLELGQEFELNTMFRMHTLVRGDVHVGFFFYSAFKVVNRGGVLITFMESKKGKATNTRVVLRHPAVVVYDVRGCGSMAIATKVNPHVQSILAEQ